MSKKKTVWVTGAKGYIGSAVAKRLESEGYLVAATDAEVSICEQERLNAFANEIRPDAIVNCAGIPRRSASLAGRIKAYEVNALGAHNVATVANAFDAQIIQISTDNVFPNRMAEPANEFDIPVARDAYGKSKRAGEVMVRDEAERYVIVRSSMVYGTHGGVLKRALDAAKAGEKVESRTDQYASPTSIRLYTTFIKDAIEKDAKGVFHITAKGVVNRDGLLNKALRICGYDPVDVLEPTQDLVTAEQVLLESMRLEMLGIELPTWEEDLQNYLEHEGLAK